MKEQFGNPSSIYMFGQNALRAIETAREKVAAALGCSPSEIYFTGCGSESDNWALKSIAERLSKVGKKHVITTVFEHHAILHTCQYLEKNGFEVTYLPVDEKGLITAEQVARAIREDTAIVSIMYANNEIDLLCQLRHCSGLPQKGVYFPN
jgi:cysteine desulfurase